MDEKIREKMNTRLAKVYKNMELLGKTRLKDVTEEEVKKVIKIVEDKWNETKKVLNERQGSKRKEKAQFSFDF